MTLNQEKLKKGTINLSLIVVALLVVALCGQYFRVFSRVRSDDFYSAVSHETFWNYKEDLNYFAKEVYQLFEDKLDDGIERITLLGSTVYYTFENEEKNYEDTLLWNDKQKAALSRIHEAFGSSDHRGLGSIRIAKGQVRFHAALFSGYALVYSTSWLCPTVYEDGQHSERISLHWFHVGGTT